MAISERSVYMNRYSGSSVKVLTVVAAFGALPAFADSSLLVENVEVVESPEAFEGFSIGLDALYSHVSVDHEVVSWGELNGGVRAENPDVKGVAKRSRCRIDPSLNLGYSRVINNWYMGVAADVSFGSNKEKKFKVSGVNQEIWTSKISGMSYGIKAKGGFYFPKLKSVVYGIAGVKWVDVDACIKGGSKAKLKSPAFLVGAGVERKLCKEFTVSAEYEYAWRNSSDTAFNKDKGDTMYTDFDQKLRGHAVKVGVKYHF